MKYFCRVFVAMTFGSGSLGQAVALTPDYGKGKEAANHIFSLLDTKPMFDNTSSAGQTLVFYLLYIFWYFHDLTF